MARSTAEQEKAQSTAAHAQELKLMQARHDHDTSLVKADLATAAEKVATLEAELQHLQQTEYVTAAKRFKRE